MELGPMKLHKVATQYAEQKVNLCESTSQCNNNELH